VPTTAKEQTVFCEKCGATVGDGASFCAACGDAVTQLTVAQTSSAANADPAIVPDSVRKSLLGQAIQQEVLAGGRIEAQTEFNAVLRFGGKRVNHILHLLLTLITFGLWVVVWISLAISSATSKYAVTLTIDEYGDISREACIRGHSTYEVDSYAPS
jgi:zinc-ribbon domain